MARQNEWKIFGQNVFGSRIEIDYFGLFKQYGYMKWTSMSWVCLDMSEHRQIIHIYVILLKIDVQSAVVCVCVAYTNVIG